MTVFNFTYPLCVGELQIAEIEGRCTVDLAPDEIDVLALEIDFYEVVGWGENARTVPAEGILRAQVDEWLWRTKADEIWAGAPRERDRAESWA